MILVKKCIGLYLIIGIMFSSAYVFSSGASWKADGVAVCDTTGDQTDQQLTADGLGGAIVVWVDGRNDLNIYAQKVNSLGSSAWQGQGVEICGTSFEQNLPKITGDGDGGAVIVWEDGRSEIDIDLFAQRIDGAGNVLWLPDGVALSVEAADQENPQITSDGAKGAIVVWEDKRDEATQGTDIYTQRIDSLGSVWAHGGIPICTATETQHQVQIASDGAGGAYIAWLDYRSGPLSFHIYMQRVDANGIPQWTADGIPICTAPNSRHTLHMIADGEGSAIIAWSDRRDWYDIYAQKVDADGTTLWTADGAGVCIYPQWQYLCKLTPDGGGGAICVWQDDRHGQWDIYARRISSAGDTLWTANGVPICTQTNIQYSPQIIADGDGGAIIAWEENRTGSDPDIYAQRIDSNGIVQWTADGVGLCAASASQNFPRMTTDGARGAIVAWIDSRSESTNGKDIYIGAVSDSGRVKVPALLRNFAANPSHNGISLHWTLAEAGEQMTFYVLREESPGYEFRELDSPCISRQGLSFEFFDGDCAGGRAYRYRIDVSDEIGRRNLFETSPITVPTGVVVLEQNYPNPFNPRTMIRFHLPVSGRVELCVFDLPGRHIVTLLDEIRSNGPHAVEWNGRGAGGTPVSSGVYLYRLKAEKISLTKKMLLLR
jgi:hypothetical protein